MGQSALPWVVAIIAASTLGAPIFALLGGIAVFLFLVEGTGPIVLMIKAHEELTSPGLGAIPLFTLAGYLLAEGQSSERLLRVFRAWFGSAPGGTAIAAAALCAFFTLLTGGSGVTILAIGGLLLPAMIKEGYRERFSVGLLTASGSLGLLFPLSLPLMLYGIVAKVQIDDLFIGGLLPGLLMLGLVAAWGVREGIRSGARRQAFRVGEAWRGAVGGQVGAPAARHRARRAAWRARQAGRSRRRRRALCAHRAAIHPPRPPDQPGRRAGLHRVRRAGRAA